MEEIEKRKKNFIEQISVQILKQLNAQKNIEDGMMSVEGEPSYDSADLEESLGNFLTYNDFIELIDLRY